MTISAYLSDWDNVWGMLFACAFILFVSLAVVGITADHKVRSYYLDSEPSVSCVMADVNWDADKKVFCSDDINKVLQVMKTANESLAQGRK